MGITQGRPTDNDLHMGTRATARVPLVLTMTTRPTPVVVIVGAGVEWMRGGDPCGRPRTL
jgi:hypothetical protein